VDGTAVFVLTDSPATRAVWDHGFLLRYEVTVGATTLRTALTVTNTGTDAFRFQALLHTYFSIEDVARVGVSGTGNPLLGCATLWAPSVAIAHPPSTHPPTRHSV
jgi:D-hexose-6-phosphate mutarotase